MTPTEYFFYEWCILQKGITTLKDVSEDELEKLKDDFVIFYEEVNK